ncbi:MAG: hypothetical protein MUO76_24710 [Anaerolineaceae bacterium]|nr:hypothetical protein [Anaerolineaceae bacterium]
MTILLSRISRGFKRRWVHARNNRRLMSLVKQVEDHSPVSNVQPVIFFNASTRLSGVSLNAAFSLLSAWALRLSGIPVLNFVCDSGLSRCVLGTNRDDPSVLPPCAECIAQSQVLYHSENVRTFRFQSDPAMECIIADLDLDAMESFTYQGMPLGELVFPSLRWILRRHHLTDDERTTALCRDYIRSAWYCAKEFSTLLDDVNPSVVVVFNGMFYPEAAARWVAQKRIPPLKVISHEVGLRPFTGFFTTGEATAYPIDIPEDFDLDLGQLLQIEKYLEQRFKGNFSMAGIRFWPEMKKIEAEFWDKASNFTQIVLVFTNVIFDTSQSHANVVFPHMFAWLDLVAEIIRDRPDTLFVIRAHPDENRPGKESCESVADWVTQSGISDLPNIIFVDADEHFSSYELIQNSKFVMVYNSTIGLEASLLGIPVLCGGKARFTQLPTVFFPETPSAYKKQAENFLSEESIDVPAEFKHHAYRFLYYQIYKTSLRFDDFLQEDGVWKGYVSFKSLTWEDLLPENSKTLKMIVDGLIYGKPFLAEE